MAKPRNYVNRHGEPVNNESGGVCNTVRTPGQIILSDGKRQESKAEGETRRTITADHAHSIPQEDVAGLAGPPASAPINARASALLLGPASWTRTDGPYRMSITMTG
jgi:hypothetical protein